MPQTRRGDVSGLGKTRVPWTGRPSEWGHTLVTSGSRRDNPTDDMLTALPTPGKPAAKSTRAVTVVSPRLHPHTQKCRSEDTAAGPQGGGGAEP